LWIDYRQKKISEDELRSRLSYKFWLLFTSNLLRYRYQFYDNNTRTVLLA
jgi:hypothetical protein